MKKDNDDQWPKIDKLIRTIDKIYPSTRELMWKGFLSGIMFGLGTTIGVSLVIAALTFALTNLKAVPVLKQIIIQTQVEDVLNPKK